eukprot:2580117-Pyramimonas_sp.AAC.1
MRREWPLNAPQNMGLAKDPTVRRVRTSRGRWHGGGLAGGLERERRERRAWESGGTVYFDDGLARDQNLAGFVHEA